jgi:DNA polymerase-3 subunit alpha (Gram-positive type)
MIYLTDKGLDRERSFKIMESVRMGIWQKKSKAYIDDLRASGISDSYIGLFDKIEYLFPKAHCANYALLSWRLLYYKLYYPEAFYNAWFKYIANESVKEYLNTGYDDIRGIYEKQQNDIETDPEELDDFLVLMEMNSRGINLR